MANGRRQKTSMIYICRFFKILLHQDDKGNNGFILAAMTSDAEILVGIS